MRYFDSWKSEGGFVINNPKTLGNQFLSKSDDLWTLRSPYWIRYIEFQDTKNGFIISDPKDLYVYISMPRGSTFLPNMKILMKKTIFYYLFVYIITKFKKTIKNTYMLSNIARTPSQVKWKEEVIKCIIWCSKDSKIHLPSSSLSIFEKIIKLPFSLYWIR